MQTRGAWLPFFLAGALLGVGGYATLQLGPGDPPHQLAAYLSPLTHPRQSPGPPGAAGLAVLFAAGALVAGRRRQERSRPDSTPMLSPMHVDAESATAVREMLVELSAKLSAHLRGREMDMIGLVEDAVQGGLRCGASDIHFHPLEDGTRISFRVHGLLEEVFTLPRALHAQLIGRLKVMARVVSYVSDRPQDGHFQLETVQGPADIRVSLLPTHHGENAVLRLARSGLDLPQLEKLGLPDPLRKQLEDVMGKMQGVIFFSGPTGSGKTTTIYASLGYIKKTRGETTRVATIEDPIEFNVPSLSQTQVNNTAGLSFAQGLRALLRQDPNAMMVGEIRDAETARIAVQAGMTGHLILTTVHAESAAGAFNRVIEMDVEPFVLASASLASVSMRLVRALCTHCRTRLEPTPEEAERLSKAGLGGANFWGSVGCPRCAQTGFLGRTAIFEVLLVSKAVRELINQKVPTPNIQDAAVAEGMVPLLEAGVEQARLGVTTLREVFRVMS